MPSPSSRFTLSILALSLSLAAPRLALSETTEWQDTQGKSFKGEPAEALGPFAIFRTGNTAGRLLAWRFLTPADCVRFHEQIRDKPARATDWAQGATGAITQELIGRVKLVQGGSLIDADLKGRPEPGLLLVFLADNSISQSWDMLGHSVAPFTKLQQNYPGFVEGLFFGLQHNEQAHANMAQQMKLPWLVTNWMEQYNLRKLAYFTPALRDFLMVAMTRDGVPLFSSNNPNSEDVEKFFGQVTGVLELLKPGNTRGWADQAHYLRAVQPVIHAHDRANPVLVGNPLFAEGLKQRKIQQVDAQIEVAADGTVTSVTIKENTGVPAPMIQPLADALKKSCVFVPAVENGSFIAGTYAYHLAVP